MKRMIGIIISLVLCGRQFASSQTHYGNPESPLFKMVRNEDYRLYSFKIEKIECDIPPRIHSSEIIGPSYGWCKLTGRAYQADGSTKSKILFVPELSGDQHYDRGISEVVVDGDSEGSTKPEGPLGPSPFEDQHCERGTTDTEKDGDRQLAADYLSNVPASSRGLQVYYPRLSAFVQNDHILVLSDHATDEIETPYGVLPMGERTNLFTDDPYSGIRTLLQAYRKKSDWQYRQINHWLTGLGYDYSIDADENRTNLMTLCAQSDFEALLSSSRGYQRVKMLEVYQHWFRESPTFGEGTAAIKYSYANELVSVIEFGNSYFHKGLDPHADCTMWYPNVTFSLKDVPTERLIAIVEKGNLPPELVPMLRAEEPAMTVKQLYRVGSNISMIPECEERGLIRDRMNLRVGVFGSDDNSQLTRKQKAVYEELVQKENPNNVTFTIFFQEYCRWKLGHQTANWFPRS